MPVTGHPELYLDEDEPFVVDHFAPPAGPRSDQPQAAVQQINEQLAVMGLRPLVFDGSRALNAMSVVDCVHALFVQLDRSKAYNEELSDALRRHKSDAAALQRKLKKAGEGLDQAQRDVSQWQLKLESSDHEHRKLRDRCQNEIAELNQRNKELNFKIVQMAKQQKRLEADGERAKERLAKFVQDKEFSAGRTGGMTTTPYNDIGDIRHAVRSGDEALVNGVHTAFEAQLEDVRGDVQRMQALLYNLNEHILQLAAKHGAGGQAAPAQKANRSVFELPFKTSREAIEEVMRYNLSLLDAALEDLARAM